MSFRMGDFIAAALAELDASDPAKMPKAQPRLGRSAGPAAALQKDRRVNRLELNHFSDPNAHGIGCL
jgi:hypothetical protein